MKKQRLIVLFTCIAIVVGVLSSIFFMALEADHDCTGPDCAICAMIHTAEKTIELISTATIATAVIFSVVITKRVVSELSFYRQFVNQTLISQRIRLNN